MMCPALAFWIRRFAPVLILACVHASRSSGAPFSGSAFPERELVAGSANSKIAVDASTGAIRRWFAVDAGPYPGEAVAAARAFLAGEAPALGLGPGLIDLDLVAVKSGLGTHHVRFRQTAGGIPVFASDVVVSLTSGGRIVAVGSDYWPGLDVAPAVPRVSEERAVQVALRDRDLARVPSLSTRPPCRELVVYPFARPARLAWRVVIFPVVTDATWEVMVDAATEEVLSVRDLTHRVDGQGFVYDPDPLTTAHVLYGGAYVDNGDATNVQLDAERRERTLKDIVFEGGRYYLAGPYAIVVDLEPPADGPHSSPTAGGFMYNRTHDSFEAVMAYYHIDTIQRWIQTLGFTDVNASQQRIDPHGLNGQNNSHYCERAGPNCPDGDFISLGDGGVDGGEDADTCVHEYGHAIQDDQVPGFGLYHEARAMGEGFGDYLAASYSQAIDNFNANWYAQWDNAGDGGNPGRRRLDSPKHYPENLDPEREEHEDGMMWSRCLWDMLNQFGRTVTDRLVIQSHFYLLPGASFRDGAEAIRQADADLYEGAHDDQLWVIFTNRGFLPTQPFDVSTVPVERYSSVAFDASRPHGRDYLVVWQDERGTNPDIRGARVTASGALLDNPDRGLKAVAGTAETRPDVAYFQRALPDTAFLVAYEAAPIMGDSAADIQAFYVTRDCIPTTPAWPITVGPLQSGFRPAVATVADTSGQGVTLVVWNGVRLGVGWGIYGARVHAVNGLLDPGGFLISAADPTFTAAFADVAYDGGGKFLVVWEGAGDNIEGAIVRRDATVVGPFTIAGTADLELQPAVTFDGVDFLVVWTRSSGASSDLYAARVDTTGAVLDPGGGFQVSTAEGEDFNPAIQMGSGRALVVWYNEPGQNAMVLGATVARDGAVYDGDGFVVAPVPTGSVTPALAFDGMTHLVTWEGRWQPPLLNIRGAIVRADSFPEVPPPGPAAVDEGPRTPPAAVVLEAPRPNPTRAGTAVTLAVPAAGRASLEVYDVTGRLMRVLHQGPLAPGTHTFLWDGRDGARRRVAAGVYFLRAETDFGATATKVVIAP